MSMTTPDIISLFEKKKQQDIKNYFDSISLAVFKKRLERSVRDCPHNLPTIIKAFFYGSPNESEKSQKRQQYIYEAVFGVLQQSLPSQMGTDLIGILLLHFDELSSECLANLAMKKLDLLRNVTDSFGRCFELLPKLLKTITTKEEIPYNGDLISGEEFKRHFVDELCSVNWLPQNATLLATVFREIPMTLNELHFIAEKLLRLFKSMDLHEIPSFIYQLLLLSAKAKGLNQTVLQGIVTVFNVQTQSSVNEESDLEETAHSKEEFRHIEGTAILHITYAMRQDQELAKEFVKFLKSNQHNPKNILVPFTVALGLAIIRFPSFKVTVLDSFKSAIVRNFKEIEMKKKSNWFREMSTNNTDVTTVFLDTVKNSTYGWDYVTQGLVQLGFVLMETSMTKPVGRKPPETSNAETLVVENPIANLGSTILLSVFKASDIVRSAILEQIFNHIFSKGSLANQCISLLGQIVQTSSLFVLDSVSKIQQTISCLPLMPPTVAVNLVKAIFPLLRINMPLKESIMLVLRKSLISGQLDSRKIAVKGYLHFLMNFKILGHLPSSQSSQTSWLSQISADVHTSLNPEMNEVLCLELLSTLTCALSQQAEIRQIVYKGLYAVISKNKKMTLPVLELLRSRVESYYETNKTVQPALKLQKIVLIENEKVILVEPLATLLMCIQKCVLSTNLHLNASSQDISDLDKIQSCIHELEGTLESLADRMFVAELEDFKLDKSAIYDITTSEGKKNNQLAVIILSIYEVLIEYLFCNEGKSFTTSEKILNLFKNYKHLISILKDDNTKKAEGKNGGRSATFKPLVSLISMESLAALINELFLREDSDFACLQDNDFLRYLITSAIQNLQEIKADEFDSDEQYFSALCHLAKTLCQYYNSHEEEVVIVDKGKKIQSLHSLSLDTLFLITTTIANKFSQRIVEFVSYLQEKTNLRNTQSQDKKASKKIFSQIQIFQKCVDKILSQDEDKRSLKDMVIFVNIITTLCPHISPDGVHVEEMLEWVQTIITAQTFGDINTVKCLLQLFLNLVHQNKNKNLSLRDLAQDIHSRLGDIDEEVQVEESKNFAIVNEQMAPVIRQILIQHFERILTEVDWILNFWKVDLCSLQKLDLDEDEFATTQQESRDTKLCNHLGLYLTSMHELVQTALPPGLAVDSFLKLLVHGYNTLNLFTKYYNSMHNLKVGKCCSRFEKLIKLTGTELSPHVYSLITYLQVLQKSDDSQKEKKKRKVDLTVQKSKILRETRQIPPLIYAIEQFETSLMQLSKKSKVNFMQHLKLSTSRDFRINLTEIEVNQSDVEEEENTSADTTAGIDDTENEEPTTKKLKLSRGRKPKS